ncbi:hypothetical protein ACPJHQ_07690 [Rossellomorea sp. H39__3]
MVMESGAHGYLIKDSTGDELIGAIRTVMTGEHVYSPKLEEPGEESSVHSLPVRKVGPIASIVNRFKSSAVRASPWEVFSFSVTCSSGRVSGKMEGSGLL